MNRITINVNGEAREVEAGMSLDDLLVSFDLRPAMIVVEHNGEILRRERYPEVRISSGDSLELVHFVGGG